MDSAAREGSGCRGEIQLPGGILADSHPYRGFSPCPGLGDAPLPRGRTQPPLQPPLPLPGTSHRAGLRDTLPNTPAVTLSRRVGFGLATAVAQSLSGDRDVWLGRRFQGNPG